MCRHIFDLNDLTVLVHTIITHRARVLFHIRSLSFERRSTITDVSSVKRLKATSIIGPERQPVGVLQRREYALREMMPRCGAATSGSKLRTHWYHRTADVAFPDDGSRVARDGIGIGEPDTNLAIDT